MHLGALIERHADDSYGLPFIRECCGRGDLDNDTVLTSTDQTRCQDVKNNLKWDPRADLNDSGDVNSTDLTLWSTKDATWDSTVVSGSTPQVAQAFSDVGNPFMFQGLPFFALDSATSATSAKLPLMHARARFLDPVTGRWLTHEPLERTIDVKATFTDGAVGRGIEYSLSCKASSGNHATMGHRAEAVRCDRQRLPA